MCSRFRSLGSLTLPGCLAICSGVLVILGLSAFVGYQVWYHRADRNQAEVLARIDAMRAEGIPVDNASLDAWYRENTDGTDTEAWLQLLEELHTPEFRKLVQGVEEFDPRADSTARTSDDWPSAPMYRALADNTTEIREQIRSLARKRVPVRFPIQFDSFNTLLEPIQRLRSVARLVKVECDVAMQDHNSSEIAASIETLFDLVVIVSKGPGLVSHLVGMAIRGVAFDSLKSALEQDLLEPSELEFLNAMLEKERLEYNHFRETISEERAMSLPAFFDIRRYSESRQEVNSGKDSAQLRASYQDIEHFLDFMEAFERIDAKTISQALAEARSIEQQLYKNIKEAGIKGVREWIMTGVACPAMDTYVTVCCEEWILHRLALHGIAIRRFEDQEMRLPTELAELKKVRFDTFSYLPVGEKPVGYMLKEDGVVLWGTNPSDGLETSDEPPVLGPEQPNNDRRLRLYWDLKISNDR